MTAERLVLEYLAWNKTSVIKPTRAIQDLCPTWCDLHHGANHTPVTYNRAWQRLVKEGHVRVLKDWREGNARVCKIAPISLKEVKKFDRIPHGGGNG